MLRSLFIISALACLATASANCVQASIGVLEGSTVTRTQTAYAGRYKYTFLDLCASSNMLISGAAIQVCSEDGDTPTLVLDSPTQIHVALMRGGSITSTEYCKY